MKITSVDSFILDVPVGREMADSMQSVTQLEFVGVNVETDAGVTGSGYTVTVGAGGEVLKAAIDTLYVEALIGRDPAHVREIWSDLYFGKAHWIGRAGATTMAQSAIDIALWDILAKAAGEPLWRYLGGACVENIPIYNTHAGWLNFSIDELCDEARLLLDQGYRSIKMKVGLSDIGEDIRRVAAVRKAVGDDITLMVDANQKWDLLKAKDAVKRLASFNLGWIEEPMHPDDISGHVALCETAAAPIALGEHVYSTHAFHEYLSRDGADIIQVDVCRIGGVTPWLEVAAMANAYGVRVCPHAGDLMQVHQHLVKTIPNRWLLEVIPIWEEGPFAEQIKLEDGFCIMPEAPGASTAFSPSAVEKYRRA